jgi:hypothetical protein
VARKSSLDVVAFEIPEIIRLTERSNRRPSRSGIYLTVNPPRSQSHPYSDQAAAKYVSVLP